MVGVTKEGKISINNEMIAEASFIERMHEIMKNSHDKLVFFNIDDEADLRRCHARHGHDARLRRQDPRHHDEVAPPPFPFPSRSVQVRAEHDGSLDCAYSY